MNSQAMGAQSNAAPATVAQGAQLEQLALQVKDEVCEVARMARGAGDTWLGSRPAEAVAAAPTPVATGVIPRTVDDLRTALLELAGVRDSLRRLLNESGCAAPETQTANPPSGTARIVGVR